MESPGSAVFTLQTTVGQRKTKAGRGNGYRQGTVRFHVGYCRGDRNPVHHLKNYMLSKNKINQKEAITYPIDITFQGIQRGATTVRRTLEETIG